MTIPDLSSRALAARTALLALCDALVSAADASHAGLAVPPPATAGEGLDDIERSAQALADFKGTIPPGASDAFMLGWRVRDREAPCDGVARTTNAPTPAPEGPVRLFPPVIVKTDVPPMVGEVCRSPAPEAKCDWCGGPHVRDVFHAADITPAPERWPTHVRITGPKGQLSVTIGKVYEVLYFDDDRARLIIKNDDGVEWGLSNKPDEGPAFPTWAPAPCPPPVAGRVEKDALRDAESQVIEAAIRWRAAYCGGAGDYINDAADERVALDSAVANLATLRSALSRPVRP